MYGIIPLLYSSEDEGRIVFVPELPSCSAFGETEEEALNEVKIAIELWLETALKEGREIPSPLGKALLAELHELAARQTAGA